MLKKDTVKLYLTGRWRSLAQAVRACVTRDRYNKLPPKSSRTPEAYVEAVRSYLERHGPTDTHKLGDAVRRRDYGARDPAKLLAWKHPGVFTLVGTRLSLAAPT